MSGWMPYLIALLLVLGSFLPLWAAAHASELPPALMLAKRYQGHESLGSFLVSEKYDGVRAYWDGVSLMTRSGRVILAPDWFLAELPDVALDGELWLGYGRFSDVSGLIRRADSDQDSRWHEVRYMVFDMPAQDGNFEQRYRLLSELLSGRKECVLVSQQRVSSPAELDRLLQLTVNKGGEGLMLHRRDSHYRPGRSTDLLKVTLIEDDEAIVIGYEPGNGRLKGLMGALRVRLNNGREFLLGTGFTDAQRREPPAIGENVRFTYRGLTSEGLPRFASFDRIRPAE